MALTRRRFLQLTGSACVGMAFGGCAINLKPVEDYAQGLKLENVRETRTICPYCSVGCGAIVHTRLDGDRRTLRIEGDPDHVINRGSLCSKGAAMVQFVENVNRLTQPLYRAPYAAEWQPVTWEWALDQIADRIKRTRDEGFIHQNDAGDVVNRVTNMASMGSAALDNEECWVYQNLLRAMGLVYIEHQARL